MCFNVMGLGFNPMPLGSSIEGKQKGIFLQQSNNNTAVQYTISHKMMGHEYKRNKIFSHFNFIRKGKAFHGLLCFT